MIWWALLLFCAGMVLILAEFLLPGGVCGGAGFLALIASGFIGVIAYPDSAAFIIAAEVVGAVFAIVFGILVVAKTPLANFLKLSKTQQEEDGYTNMPSDQTLLGAAAVVYTALRPSGTILIGDRRVDAVANGTFVPKDAPVKVIEVHGNRVVVEATATEDMD